MVFKSLVVLPENIGPAKTLSRGPDGDARPMLRNKRLYSNTSWTLLQTMPQSGVNEHLARMSLRGASPLQILALCSCFLSVARVFMQEMNGFSSSFI
mmetsp:Transcript_8729/g.17273  ORF Transcript_8729/g.17273 Transcript_8729/m.17273 type:complete len:97 (-) Transcript_8729:6-296(-)